MDMKVKKEPFGIGEIKDIARDQFGDMVKAVVDVEKELIAMGGELHADEETLLLEQGSEQGSLWGINLYVGKGAEDWIEFDSLINIRPAQNNRSRDVEDSELRKRITAIVNKLVLR